MRPLIYLLTRSVTGIATPIMQQAKITGTITDENGSPFPGVYIPVEGTTIGTISDVNGKVTHWMYLIPMLFWLSHLLDTQHKRISLAGKTTVDFGDGA